MKNDWKLDDGRTISLLTLKEFDNLPMNTELIDIFGESLQKRPDTDTDTRFGFVAYGFLKSEKRIGI